MKHKLLTLLFATVSLFIVSQNVAQAGVENSAGIWLLSPASWHPNPNKLHDNYPFALNKNQINMGDGEEDDHDRQHPLLSERTVNTPVYNQRTAPVTE